MNTSELFRKHGWVIMKDFFNDDEVAKIKAATERSVSENMGVDLLCNPFLKHLTILNPKIISLVSELIQDAPVYIGDSTISYNDMGMSLHKDNPDKSSSQAPDWLSEYTVLRMGIYLQDYSSTSGGLILRDKSHNTVSRWSGKIVNVKSSPRDLIIWNLRTTHSGNAKRLKAFPSLDLNPYVCKVLPEGLFLKAPQRRMALFLSYGKDDHHLKRYIAYLKTRKYAADRWKGMIIDKEDFEYSKKIGLRIWDLTDEAKKIDNSTLHEKHVELDY